MKKLLSCFILLVLLLPGLCPAHEIHIVVNKKNPIKHLTQKQVTDLYMGRAQYFPDGNMVVKIDAPNNSGLRKAFYSALANMSIAEVNAYWARLLFSGRAAPPMSVTDGSEVIQLVETNPNAVGYVTGLAENMTKVKIVAVIHIPDA